MAGQGLKIRVKKEGSDVRVVKLKGVIDGHTSPTFEKALSDIIENKISRIILDFSKVSYLSSAGVGVLISTQGKMDEELKEEPVIVIANAIDSVRDVFKILEIDRTFNFTDNVEDGVSLVRKK